MLQTVWQALKLKYKAYKVKRDHIKAQKLLKEKLENKKKYQERELAQ